MHLLTQLFRPEITVPAQWRVLKPSRPRLPRTALDQHSARPLFPPHAGLSLTASAQEDRRNPVGTVTDPVRRGHAQRRNHHSNTDTNQPTHLTTNQGGEYVAADLPIGHYVVRAEASGFKAGEQKNITLNVGSRTRADIKLEVGNTQQSVTVEATAIAVQTESGEVSDVITGQQISQLATNGRSIYSLATLTRGSVK